MCVMCEEKKEILRAFFSQIKNKGKTGALEREIHYTEEKKTRHKNILGRKTWEEQ